MDLPSGLNVYDVLVSALDNPEYRGPLLRVIGYIFWSGFFLGVLTYMIIDRKD